MAGLKRRIFAAFIGSWLVWFVCSAAMYGGGIVRDIGQRGQLAWISTLDLFEAIGRAVFSWINLSAPFLIDVYSLILRIDDSLSPKTKMLSLAITAVLLGTFFSVKRILTHKDSLLNLLFQTSIIVIAPLLWLLLGVLPNPQASYLAPILKIVTNILPCVLSLRAFLRRDRKACGMWLRYWVVFPVVETTIDLVTTYNTNQHISEEIMKIVIIFTIWLQAWDGSLAFHFFCSALTGSILKAIPKHNIFKIPENTTVLKKIVMCFTENIALAAIVLVSVAVPFILFFNLLSKVVPMMIMWGASLNAAEVVVKKIEPLYEQKIAYWILSQASSLILLQIPVAATVFGIFRIPTLVCFYMFGHTILNIVGRGVSFSSSSKNTTSTVMSSPFKENVC